MATYEAVALPEFEGAAPVWRAAYPLGEAETEAFFESVAEHAAGGGHGPGLGAAAAAAASSALAGGVPLAQVGVGLGTGNGYIQGEGEFEAPALEMEALSPEMLMEHLGHAAAEAESETEAEAFIFPLLPLAAKAILPRLAPMLMRRVAPRLVRSATQVTRTLRRNPQTRPLVRVMPTIVRRTVHQIGRDIDRGRPVTGPRAVRVLAGQTQRVLADPHAVSTAYRHSRALDRHYHLICRRVPH
jgi:hypothetical protein